MLQAVVAHGVAASLLAPMALRHRMDLWMVGISKNNAVPHVCLQYVCVVHMVMMVLED